MGVWSGFRWHPEDKIMITLGPRSFDQCHGLVEPTTKCLADYEVYSEVLNQVRFSMCPNLMSRQFWQEFSDQNPSKLQPESGLNDAGAWPESIHL